MKRRSLSLWPVIVAGALDLVSVLLAFLVIRRFNTDAVIDVALIGYLVTPFAVAGALIWAQTLDLRLQGDPGYRRLEGRRRLKFVGLLALISFVPALVHIVYIASFVGALWA